jgi:hypothetical protein
MADLERFWRKTPLGPLGVKNIPSRFDIYIIRTIYYFFFMSNSDSLVVLNLKVSGIGSSILCFLE